MIFLSWIALVAISLGISLLAFLWAMRAGQFSDQGRARFLPLSDSRRSPALEEKSVGLPVEIYVLLGIAGIALGGILFSIVLSIFRV